MNAPRRYAFEPPEEVHHAPGIPCGMLSRRPDIPVWYTEEPAEVTCRHRGCKKWKREQLEARRCSAPFVLASLEALG